jgi:hypothetical protein
MQADGTTDRQTHRSKQSLFAVFRMRLKIAKPAVDNETSVLLSEILLLNVLRPRTVFLGSTSYRPGPIPSSCSAVYRRKFIQQS